MTILDVITSATGYLEKHAVEDPRLNAEHLLAHVLGKKRLDLYLEFDRPLDESERAPLRELVRGRGEGTPLQHLLGSAPFFGRDFRSDARALIPRPETEQLAELILTACPAPLVLLDVGTGSGVLAITLALERPGSEVHATDVSPAALALACENAASLGAAVTFHEADLLPPGDQRFDAIVANLPYIPTADIAALSREVRRDPANALDGGPDGLDLIRRLVAAAPSRLQPGGHVFLEIGHDQAAAVQSLLTAEGFCEVTSHPDYAGHGRFIHARFSAT